MAPVVGRQPARVRAHRGRHESYVVGAQGVEQERPTRRRGGRRCRRAPAARRASRPRRRSGRARRARRGARRGRAARPPSPRAPPGRRPRRRTAVVEVAAAVRRAAAGKTRAEGGRPAGQDGHHLVERASGVVAERGSQHLGRGRAGGRSSSGTSCGAGATSDPIQRGLQGRHGRRRDHGSRVGVTRQLDAGEARVPRLDERAERRGRGRARRCPARGARARRGPCRRPARCRAANLRAARCRQACGARCRPGGRGRGSPAGARACRAAAAVPARRPGSRGTCPARARRRR